MSYTGQTRFTIARNGVIGEKRKGAHKCGNPGQKTYPYRVTLQVTGELLPPDYFVVANETVDDHVQAVFVKQRTQGSTSCEKMCADICHAMRDMMREYPQWSTEHIKVELTGTNGTAWLSCEWSAPNAKA